MVGCTCHGVYMEVTGLCGSQRSPSTMWVLGVKCRKFGIKHSPVPSCQPSLYLFLSTPESSSPPVWQILSPEVLGAILLIWLQRSIARITNCQEGKNQALVAFFRLQITKLLTCCLSLEPCLALRDDTGTNDERVCKNMVVHKVVMLAAAIPSSCSRTGETTADRLPEWLPEGIFGCMPWQPIRMHPGCWRQGMAAGSGPKGKRVLCTVRVWELDLLPTECGS